MKRKLAATVLGSMTIMSGVQAKPVLDVYTYSSFTSEWGPGPELERRFEASCGCDLVWTSVDDGVAILSRLKLEGASSKADVVLGLDSSLTAEAKDGGFVAPHGQDLSGLTLPVMYDDPSFVPYDWGYFAFVYDRTRLPNPPKSLAELADAPPDLTVVIQDPRTSTPGLGLLLWVKAVHGEDARAYWEKLAPHILTVTSGWSEAYDLFLKGEASMVLSYTTSPAYHMVAESKDDIQAAPFTDGHYLQVEVAALAKNAQEPELAKRFLQFLLSSDAQSILPTTNWMYPAKSDGVELPEEFSRLIQPGKALLTNAETVRVNRAAWVDEWFAALGR
ncbi:MAG TPA: thiamine ABC transporter substrate binding subunit [Geminicoccus sp.]|jgi:thiamine transport system substrate-binding protein|uniref:thiamine ABC transporter substrate binding subunit n=1 Tax=Geminicoccus sp. TaxID=2024832 RepID=UPI002E300271|nr:thiamine ABC transporter substrate binding subunit [Geminicoccus sp.]HEX2529274.1 thiamine ABC transporter substrate binding subunit [Geminicoccus sp.]